MIIIIILYVKNANKLIKIILSKNRNNNLNINKNQI